MIRHIYHQANKKFFHVEKLCPNLFHASLYALETVKKPTEWFQ